VVEEEFRAVILQAVTPVFWTLAGEPLEWTVGGQPLQWNVGTVTRLVGQRISWGAQPQGLGAPYIVLQRISGAEGYTTSTRDGLEQARVQVDCWGATYAEAKTVSRAVVEALSGYSGGNFYGIFHAGSRDMREGGTNEAERLFRVSMDFMAHWRTT